MCNLKSGILLKDRVLISATTDSHSEILASFNVADNRAVPNFVKVELIPPEHDVFSNSETWRYVVDQDTLPDWYCPKLDERRFRDAVKEWTNHYVLINRQIDVLPLDGEYYLKDCTVEWVSGGTVEWVSGGTVEWVSGGTVKEVSGGTVKEVSGGTVEWVSGGTVNRVSGNARVEFSCYNPFNSTKTILCDNAIIIDPAVNTIWQSGAWSLKTVDKA
jgi:hypothetical protein